MAKSNVHVTFKNNVWNVKSEGTSKPCNTYDTKSEALARGRQVAQNKGVELVIHGKNGRIQDKDSFGKDSCPPKDKVM